MRICLGNASFLFRRLQQKYIRPCHHTEAKANILTAASHSKTFRTSSGFLLQYTMQSDHHSVKQRNISWHKQPWHTNNLQRSEDMLGVLLYQCSICRCNTIEIEVDRCKPISSIVSQINVNASTVMILELYTTVLQYTVEMPPSIISSFLRIDGPRGSICYSVGFNTDLLPRNCYISIYVTNQRTTC